MATSHDPLCDQTHTPRQKCNDALAGGNDATTAAFRVDVPGADEQTTMVTIGPDPSTPEPEAATIIAPLRSEATIAEPAPPAMPSLEREAASEGVPSTSDYASQAWGRTADSVSSWSETVGYQDDSVEQRSGRVTVRRAALGAAGIGAIALLVLMRRGRRNRASNTGGGEGDDTPSD